MYSQIIYEGDLRCRLINMDSGIQVLTDAPKENGGKGEQYSPTDLVAATLGACILTVMGIAAQKNGFSVNGTTCEVNKEMTTAGDRRIAKIDLCFKMASGISKDRHSLLEHTAKTCPVFKSLHPDITIGLKFDYPDNPR
jgi:uncharacterized OsmC-like protein